jgi:CDGSH-type Zn-finger protein
LKVVRSNGTPEMKMVEVAAKNCCCGDGARKPFCS